MNPLWKDIATILGPIIGILIGWFLSEYAQKLKMKREDRRALGKAISDLLEVYDIAAQIRVAERILQAIKAPSPSTLKLVKDRLDVLSNIYKRYEETLNILAASNPILAFRLRSKIGSVTAIYEMRKEHESTWDEAAQNDELKQFLLSIDDLHQSLKTEELKRALLSISREHGLVTKYRVKKAMKEIDSLETTIPDLSKQLVEGLTNTIVNSPVRQSSSTET